MMLVLRKKNIISLLLCIAVGIMTGLGIQYIPKAHTFGFGSDQKLRVIVDAGHGAPDGGAVGANGTLEKDINLAISKKVQEVLEGKGIDVIMTRMGDSGLQTDQNAPLRDMKRSDMNTRLSIMKKSNSDLFITIHMNYFQQKSVNGLHIFYSKNHSEIAPLAEAIQERMNDVTGAKTHAIMAADKSLFLMKNPPIPSILVECGFLSNAQEETKLNDDDYQSRVAWAIADSVEKYYQANPQQH